MVLQRNQVSVSGFLNNGTIFGLTIVCAVLGLVTSYTGESREMPQSQVFTMNSGSHLAGHHSAMARCEHSGECGEALKLATDNLFSVAKFSVLALPFVSQLLYGLSFIFMMFYLEPVT
jgi:hypothetical protein